MITRRDFLRGLGAAAVAGAGLAGYAFGYEPLHRLAVTRYAITPPAWPIGFRLRLAAIADLHACDPLMTVERLEQIVEVTNGLGADAILLLGDYEVNAKFWRRPLLPSATAAAACIRPSMLRCRRRGAAAAAAHTAALPSPPQLQGKACRAGCSQELRSASPYVSRSMGCPSLPRMTCSG